VDGARDLVVLPPLTTHKAGVPFTDLDRNAYTNLSAKSQAKYRAILHDARHAKRSHIQHHAQRMMAELSNLRQACSGGQLAGCHKAQPPQAGAACGACLGVPREHPVELSPCKHAMCGPCWRARTEDDAESAPSRMKCSACEAAVDSTAPYAGTDVIPPVAVDPSQHGVVMHSKLLAVVSHLKHIRSKDPSAKSIIFSQYATAIEFLKNELPKHGFEQPQAPLAAFQSSPSTTVVSVALRLGAVGINLTAASNVFLLDPCLDVEMEAHAVGRVCRMGQMRPVNVYKVFVEDSVESRILQLQENQQRAASASVGAPSEAAPLRQPGDQKDNPARELRVQDFNFLFGVGRRT
jgi:hypothetical protein